MTARRSAVPLVALAFLLAASALPAASLVVPSLDVITMASMDAGRFVLTSIGDFDLVVEGGYKFGGRIGLSYADSSLEETSLLDGIEFDGISVIVRDVFALPLSLSWFIGSYDVLASGSEFPISFGTAEIASAYRGFMYFPTGIQYDGIHQVKGTGLRIATMPVADKLMLAGYLYQDSWLIDAIGEKGHWAADLRVLANLEAIKLEGFLGVTSMSTAGWYRGGMLFYASMKSLEILAELGIPKWDPVSDPFSINMFSMLFEPRLQLGLFNVAATFFWHPEYYHQELTGELGTFDVNLNLFLGDFTKTLTLGGLEGNLGFDSTAGSFDVTLAPYISFATPGAVWKIKVNTKLLPWPAPFDLAELFEGFVGIRASF
jgi:hypothetical protein